MTSGNLRVLLAASEALPFDKTGGLADVMGALPGALARRGIGASLIIPLSRTALNSGHPIKETAWKTSISIGDRIEELVIYKSALDVPHDIYLLRHDASFDRPYLYGPPESAYPDNARRFAIFARGVVELARRLEPSPDLIHCHDWQSALVPLVVDGGVPTVLTIHNLGYQGVFPAKDLDAAGIPARHFHPEGVEFFGKVNFLKAGIVWADRLTTVSPSYAREILAPEQGFGLDGLLRRHARKLSGILNGADDDWDPSRDPYLAARFSAGDLAGKETCKRDLLRRFGLPDDPGPPLLGMVARLTPQKGVDLLLPALPGIAAAGARLVLLGSGDPALQKALREAAQRMPGVRAAIGFDEAMAHRIVAGADFFLMPSRYEPCGLNQMYALRYGTIPVVRATGGLRDTVAPWDRTTGKGNGFLFDEASPAALAAAVGRALAAWSDPEARRRLQDNGMSADHSWARAAAAYEELYRQVLAARAAAGRTP